MAALRGAAPSKLYRKRRRASMADAAFLALGLASFAALIAYVFFCERQ
jgi:hypothetical protein